MNTVLNQPCPEIPFFGAPYPDARCIDGYLWDLDSDENGGLTQGGEIPCPFCNTKQFIEYDPLNLEDGNELLLLGSMDSYKEELKSAKEVTRDEYLGWINKMKEQYGKYK